MSRPLQATELARCVRLAERIAASTSRVTFQEYAFSQVLRELLDNEYVDDLPDGPAVTSTEGKQQQ